MLSTRTDARLTAAVLTALVLLTACASAPPAPEGDERLRVDVASEPFQALISFKGRELGKAPLSLMVDSYDELVEIEAEPPQESVVERRLRFPEGGSAEVVFRFSLEPLPAARALGLSNVVIFDYSEYATFDTDSAELRPEFERMLVDQAEVLNTYFEGIDVWVCGHTDDTGTSEHNLVLSLERAEAVSSFLIANGVDRARLRTQGFGADYPVADNSDPKGRALNRRTEVVLPH